MGVEGCGDDGEMSEELKLTLNNLHFNCHIHIYTHTRTHTHSHTHNRTLDKHNAYATRILLNGCLAFIVLYSSGRSKPRKLSSFVIIQMGEGRWEGVIGGRMRCKGRRRRRSGKWG